MNRSVGEPDVNEAEGPESGGDGAETAVGMPSGDSHKVGHKDQAKAEKCMGVMATSKASSQAKGHAD